MIKTTTPDTEKMSRWNNQLIEKIVSFAHGTLSQCLAELFANCHDPEFRRPPSVINLYTRYDALDALETYQDSFARTFTDQFIKGVLNPTVKDQHNVHVEDDPYLPQIIETDNLELDEAVSPIVQRIEDSHKITLLHLDLRLDYLNGHLTDPIDPQGLHPKALFEAFQISISALSLRLPGKVLLCEIFEQQLSSALEQLYRDINQTLIDAGILDSDSWIDHALHTRENKHRQPSRRATQIGYTDNNASDDVQTVAKEGHRLLSHSQNELTVLGSVTENKQGGSFTPTLTEDEFLQLLVEPNTPGTGSSLSKYQRSHLTAALSALQRETLKSGVSLNVDELESAVTRILYNSGIFNANELIQAEHPVITFVNQIFQTLLDDETGSGSVNPLIARLLIPTIKLALLDFEFFKNPQHPAREFLNHLATLTIGVVDDTDPLTSKLQAIINKILSRFDTNVGVFEEPLTEIRQLAESESERIRITEEKAQREAEIKARRSTARGNVTALIQRLMKNKKLSRELKDFIQGCWTPYMALIFSAQGPRSQDWKDSLHIVRRLVEATQPGKTLEEFDRLIGPADAHCEQLKGKLTQLKLDQKNPLLIKRVCVWLEHFHDRLASSKSYGDNQPSPILSVDELAEEDFTGVQRGPIGTGEEITAEKVGTLNNPEDGLAGEQASLPTQSNSSSDFSASKQEPFEPVYYDDNRGIEPDHFDDNHGIEPDLYDDSRGIEPDHFDDNHGIEPDHFDDNHGIEPDHFDDNHGIESDQFDDDHDIKDLEDDASEAPVSHPTVSVDERDAEASETAKDSVNDNSQEPDLLKSRDRLDESSNEDSTPAKQTDSVERDDSSIDDLLNEIEKIGVHENDLDKLLKSLPSHVKPGTWYEIYQAEDRAKRRLKLSAILQDTGQVLFANRLGEGELTIDLETFLEDLREGYSKPINDNNLFDRALTTVISNIRESQEHRSSR